MFFILGNHFDGFAFDGAEEVSGDLIITELDLSYRVTFEVVDSDAGLSHRPIENAGVDCELHVFIMHDFS